MQLLNIATISIALFGFGYFLIALTAHLHHCWQHPPVKIAAPATAIAPTVEPEPTPLLLPAATTAEIPHPWEIAADRLLNVEPILALQPPVVEDAPEAVAFETPELLEMAPTEVAPEGGEAPAHAPGLTSLSIRQLKALASERKLPRYSSMTKPQLMAALS